MKIIERHRYKDKKIFETRKLTFESYTFNELNMCLVMGLIQKNLTPDLLKRKKLMYKGDPSKYYGHCYHASQALYYLMETKKLVPMSGEDYRGEKHWWLQNGDNIYDCTAEQYLEKGEIAPYHVGKKSVWYGWKQRPHQISLNLMKKVLTDRLISDTIESY
tara:strand:- start:1722 stop:2204 length:483 start_codon:yes stop_codon:yes gene_type:complete